MGVIYKHTINNKSYIGCTTISMEERLKQHIRSSEKGFNTKFYNSIRKYGEENIESIILEECEDKDLKNREKYWIKYFDTYNSGLNGTEGGDGGNTRQGMKNSKEHCEKISRAQLGKQKKNKGMCGKYKKSDSHKKKLSESVSNELWVSNNIHTIKIKKELEGEFLSKGYVKGRKHHINVGKNNGSQNISKEDKAKQVAKAKETNENKELSVCRYCGYKGKDFAVTRWHNDNCKNK